MSGAMDVSIELNVPDGTEPLEYRNLAEKRARELGWPQPHSAGTCFAYERLVADLAWQIDDDSVAAGVIHILRNEFDVRSVHVD